MSTSDRWYYRQGEAIHGPCAWSELTFLAVHAELTEDDEVRRETDEDWQRAGSVAGLFPSAADKPQPLVRGASNARTTSVRPAVSSRSAPGGVTPYPQPPGAAVPPRPVPPRMPAKLPAAESRRRAVAMAGAGFMLALLLLLAAWLLSQQVPRRLGIAGGRQGGTGSAAQDARTGENPGSGQDNEPTAAEAPAVEATPAAAANSAPQQPAKGAINAPGVGDGTGPPEEPEPPPPPAIALVRPIGAKPAGQPSTGSGNANEFFNLKAGGTRFVYVVDCSWSMAGDPLSRACRELLDSVNRLEPSQSFFVVFFSEVSWPQFYPSAESKLIPSTPKNRRRLRDWVARIGPMSGTEPLESLLLALSLKPDAIYFLTDGQFSPLIADAVRHHNSERIPIHTIAYIDPAGERLLEQIARESGGAHRFVP